MDLNSLLTVIGIISPFIISAVWLATLTTKTSNRALLLEITSKNQEKRIAELEIVTSYASIEKVVEKVCLHVFNSREFKETMSESIQSTVEKSVKNTLLHIEKNRVVGQAGSFEEILNAIHRVQDEIKHKK